MAKKLLFPVLCLLVGSVVLAACASNKTSPDLSATNWKLVSYGPVSDQTLAAPGIDTLLKFGADGKVGGNLGCNSFGGDYTQKGDQVTFGPLISTLMACQEPQMSQEGISFAILTGTVNLTINGDSLTITDASGKNELVFTRK